MLELQVKSGERLTFRSSFVHAIQWACAFFGVVGAIAYLAAWATGNAFDVPPTVGFVAAFAVFSAVMVFVYPVYVSFEGVRTYDAFGSYESVGWPAIDVVRTFNILGLKYLTFSAPSGRRLYVPTWLADMEGFAAAVRERAGPRHPLATATEDLVPRRGLPE
jgi:hypothetical protein